MIDLLANWELENTDGDEKALQRVLTARAGGKWEGVTPVNKLLTQHHHNKSLLKRPVMKRSRI